MKNLFLLTKCWIPSFEIITFSCWMSYFCLKYFEVLYACWSWLIQESESMELSMPKAKKCPSALSLLGAFFLYVQSLQNNPLFSCPIVCWAHCLSLCALFSYHLCFCVCIYPGIDLSIENKLFGWHCNFYLLL